MADRSRRLGGLLALGVLILLGGLYGLGYAFTGDRVPRGTTVAGVDIGGLAPAAAKARLRQALSGRADEPIRLRLDGQQYLVWPDDVGLRVDVAASVAAAGATRTLNPWRMLDALIGGDAVAPVVEADDARLDEAVDRLAGEVYTAPVEPRIEFRGRTPMPTRPVPGHRLDRAATAAAITSAYLVAERAVPLRVRTVPPQIGAEQLRVAMRDVAVPAMSGPVTLRFPAGVVRLQPSALAALLSVEPRGDRLVPEVDSHALWAHVAPDLAEMSTEGRDATVLLRSGQPRVVSARPSWSAEPHQVADAVLAAVGQSGGARVATVRTDIKPVDFTTADARALRIRERVSSFTTFYPHAQGRNVNIGRAAELIDGTVLRPGEVFSLNDTVGERTKENGFAVSYVLTNGVVTKGYGGGVSQVATTTFNAAFFACRADIDHQPSSM